MLKALAKRLLDFKEEFYTLSYRTGATKDDSWIDIDGGIGTVFAYAEQGHARAREQPAASRWARRGTVEVRHFRRPAHLRAARGRRRAHQCLQFPRVGHAREARARIARRRAGDRQARDRDRVSHRTRGAAHRRVGRPARRRAAARVRHARRSLRSSDLPGHRVLHRARRRRLRSCARIPASFATRCRSSPRPIR